VKFSNRRRREDPPVDLTAMLDVAFNLVLFFMVTTTFVQKRGAAEGAKEASGIQVDLPRSSAQAVLVEQKDVNVWMTLDGQVYVNDEAVDEAGLKKKLRSAAEANPNTMVVIKADRGVTHGRVVSVMDEARSVGLTKLAIATDPM
jgi:biopolymer transport protein ExbD